MKRIRPALLTVFASGAIVSAFFFHLFAGQHALFLGGLALVGRRPFAIPASVALFLLAVFLRARNSRLLVSLVRPADTPVLFHSLVRGSAIGAVLPFRLGELARAHFLGRSLCVSRTVMLFTILIERLIDSAFLLLLSALIFFRANRLSVELPPSAHFVELVLLSEALFAVTALALLFWQPPWVLRVAYYISSLFNERLCASIRYGTWSAMYGVNILFKRAPWRRYLLGALVMWAVSLGSVLALAYSILALPLSRSLAVAAASYMSVAVPSGPGNFGTFHYYFSDIISSWGVKTDQVGVFAFLVWLLFLVPLTLLGCYSFALRPKSFPPRPRSKALRSELALDAKLNKLDRHADVSSEFAGFLADFFLGNSLSALLNSEEIRGNHKLIRVFPGGSNAKTVLLADDHGDRFVRKLVSRADAPKLKSQMLWLRARDRLPNLPRILREKEDARSYSYDLELVEDGVPFFEFIHLHSNDDNWAVLSGVLDFARESIHVSPKPVFSRRDLSEYLRAKVIEKARDAAALNRGIADLMRFDTILINGKAFDNLAIVIDRLFSRPELLEELATFQRADIHGDLTVDNIVVGRTGFVLLDPNDDNLISDPLVDYAKLFQSLHSGYEFLCKLEKISQRGERIDFVEEISAKYTDLFRRLKLRLQAELPPARERAIYFHEAVHFCRMLTYRARLRPETAPAFYAVATRLFNEFYERCQ